MKTLFGSAAALLALIVVVFETGVIPSGIMSDETGTAEYMLSSIMTILTLAGIYLSLRRLGQLPRIIALAALALADTILYYLFMAPSFGYLAIITIIASAFAYPKKEG